MEDNSREAALKSFAVKSMNLCNWQYNPHVSSCVSMKQHLVGPCDTHELAQVSVFGEIWIILWSTLTCTMLCGMSWAAVGTVSLIYQDKCKHIKSQAHTDVLQGIAYQELCTISSGYKNWMYSIVIRLVRSGLKHNILPVSIWVCRSAVWMSHTSPVAAIRPLDYITPSHRMRYPLLEHDHV